MCNNLFIFHTNFHEIARNTVLLCRLNKDVFQILNGVQNFQFKIRSLLIHLFIVSFLLLFRSFLRCARRRFSYLAPCTLPYLWFRIETKPVTFGYLLFIPMGWDYISQPLPQTGLLFISQVVWEWRAMVVWYWHDKIEELRKNLSQYHFVHHESHTDWQWRKLGWEAGD